MDLRGAREEKVDARERVGVYEMAALWDGAFLMAALGYCEK
jgi:hypothetical protein